MPISRDILVVDTLLDLPGRETAVPARLRTGSDGTSEHPASYMFKDLPAAHHRAEGGDPIGDTLREMDKYNIEIAVVAVNDLNDEVVNKALTKHRHRFAGVIHIDPNDGIQAVRLVERAVTELGVVGASFFPSGCNPPVPINDKRAYPIYAKCVELDIAVFVNAGVPGPRLPYASQHPGLADEVCWFFPDLKFIYRHGCEPWADLAVKLLLKWPNLYYSTSAFAPKYYPKEIVEFANKRGADKVIYAGYYPLGLTLERIFRELPNVPFRDHVWPKFLSENARRVLKLDKR